jgi:hypothetical protein
MEKSEESQNKEKSNNKRTTLTHEENMKLMQYPEHYRKPLREVILRGESVEEAYKELEWFDYMS